MSYRPITDIWMLARAKLTEGQKYYGAYPGGFLERARALLGVTRDSYVLHVCGGRLKNYPYPRGLGRNDFTLDLDPALEPDFLQDARDPFPKLKGEYVERVGSRVSVYRLWDAVLIDPPYTPGDAEKYKPGPDVFPKPNQLLKNALQGVKPGGKVGMLHYLAPSKGDSHFVACIGVFTGFNNRMRVFSVYERPDSTD